MKKRIFRHYHKAGLENNTQENSFKTFKSSLEQTEESCVNSSKTFYTSFSNSSVCNYFDDCAVSKITGRNCRD